MLLMAISRNRAQGSISHRSTFCQISLILLLIGFSSGCSIMGSNQIASYEEWKHSGTLDVQAGRMTTSAFAEEARTRAKAISMAPNYSRIEVNRMGQIQLIALQYESGEVPLAQARLQIGEVNQRANAEYQAHLARQSAANQEFGNSLQDIGIALMQAGAAPQAHYPTNCTTTYIGNMATTNCY
jgi:hypothetical protein